MSILDSISPNLMCEAQTLRGRRCCCIPSGRHNGKSLCMRHLRKSEKADKEKENHKET